MTLPSSGTITSTQVIAELGLAPGSTITIPTDVRTLTGVSVGSIVWPTNFHGKRGILGPPDTGVGRVGANAFPNQHLITIPSGANVGDVAFLFDMPVSNTATLPSFGVPSGWTLIGDTNGLSDSGLGFRAAVSYRILTAGQPGSTITGMTGSEYARKIMIVFRPAYPISSVSVAGWTVSLGGGDISPIVIGASGQSTNLIVLGFAAAQNTIASMSWSPAATDVNTNSTTLAGYKLYTGIDTSANHTIDIGDNGDTNGLAGGYVRFVA